MILTRGFYPKKPLAWFLNSHGLIHTERDCIPNSQEKFVYYGFPPIFNSIDRISITIKASEYFSMIICPNFNNDWRIEVLTPDDCESVFVGDFKKCLNAFTYFENCFKESGGHIDEPDVDNYSMELGLRVRWHQHLLLRKGNEQEKIEHKAYIQENEMCRNLISRMSVSEKWN